jgi:hypothetical protein
MDVSDYTAFDWKISHHAKSTLEFRLGINNLRNKAIRSYCSTPRVTQADTMHVMLIQKLRMVYMAASYKF